VERYAILDDDTDMLPEQLPNFFQTTWEEGLTEEIAEKVIAHLGETKPTR
jgi:membrane-bound lytic murein transglycosylase MltF